MTEQINLPSIRDRDLRNILEHFNLSQDLVEGKIQCEVCGDIVTWDNLGAIYVIEGKIRLICGLSECIGDVKKDGKND